MQSEIFRACKKLYPVKTLRNIVRQVRFLIRAHSHRHVLARFFEQLHAQGYGFIFNQNPHLFGAVEWPYIHNQWDVAQRFDTILGHYQLIKSQPDFLDVADEKPKKVLDLSEYSSGVSVVVDRAVWFRREGEIVLNLFKDDLRVESIAFTLANLDGDLVLYVGAIQGIHANENSLEINKALTKELEGMRPRSFVIELLRMIAQHIGANKIYAISDENRHHRHPYFASQHQDSLKTHYDSIWEEHGGEVCQNGFFLMPIDKRRKELADVSSNKRAMYRRRYEMLDNIGEMISRLQCAIYAAVIHKFVQIHPVGEMYLILC
ncbi:MAG: DUF535 family protein [Methylophilus sp.]|nr:DUF535 family protein [Methylophilus sp.]